MNVRDYTFRYSDSETPVFSGLDFTVERGDRIALHGANGCGKSTLIKSILTKCGMDSLTSPYCESGLCETASGLVVSYINQNTDSIKGTVQEFCIRNGLDLSMLCTVLRQLDFERSLFDKNMQNYSEGQKKKVLIASSLITPAHLYIWDEPLNYIDVFSRMQIEKLILRFSPAMLFVEHDTAFREKIASKTVEFG